MHAVPLLRTHAVAALAVVAVLSASPAFAGGEDGFRKALEKEVASRDLEVSAAFEKAVKDGALELESGNYELAVKYLDQAYRENKNHPFPPFLIGLACIGLGKYEEAASFFLYALHQWPTLHRAGPDLKRWLLGDKEHARLAARLEAELFSLKPGTAKASSTLFLAGLFHAFGGDPGKAWKFLSAVPEDAKERTAARLVLHAVEPPASAKKPAPSGPDPFELGNRYFVQGRYLEAAHAYGLAVANDPGNSLAYFEMGHALFAAGYYHHAARVLAMGIERCPRWAAVDMDRASFYPEERRLDYKRQLKRLETWTQEHPDDGASLFLLGYNLYFSRHRDASRPVFEAASRAGWDDQASCFLDRLDGKAPAEGEKDDPSGAGGEDAPGAAAGQEDRIAEGRRRLAAGDFDGAIQIFALAHAFPDEKTGLPAMMGLAASWLGKGAFANASHWLRASFRTDPSGTENIPWAGAFGEGDVFETRLAALAKRSRQIDENLRAGREPGREGIEIWFLYGYCLYRRGEREKAANRIEEILLQTRRGGEVDREALALFQRIKG